MRRVFGTLPKRLTLFGFSTLDVHTRSLASLSVDLSFSSPTSTPMGHTTTDFIVPRFLLLLFPFQSSVSLWMDSLKKNPFINALEGHLRDVRGQKFHIIQFTVFNQKSLSP